MNRKTIVVVTAALACALALLGPLSASAHVRLISNTAKAGASPVQLTFTVPTESQDPSVRTTNVEIDLPVKTPFGSVTTQPVEGWTSTIRMATLSEPVKIGANSVTSVPSAIVWTADAGTALVAGQFQNFVVSVGPVPDVGRVRITATQTLSDASEQRWDGHDADHPAPTLYVNDTPPVSTGGMQGMGMGMSSGEEAGATSAVAAPGVGSGLPIALSVLAAAVAAAALIISLRGARHRGGTRSDRSPS